MNAKMVNTVATRTVALMSFQIVRRGSGMRSSISERNHLLKEFYIRKQREARVGRDLRVSMCWGGGIAQSL